MQLKRTGFFLKMAYLERDEKEIPDIINLCPATWRFVLFSILAGIVSAETLVIVSLLFTVGFSLPVDRPSP
jgi:hypothetical protein